MTGVPKPSPLVFPRMYTKTGKLLHRARQGALHSLCLRASFRTTRAIEGQEANPLIGLIEFSEAKASRLARCQECHEYTGRFE